MYVQLPLMSHLSPSPDLSCLNEASNATSSLESSSVQLSLSSQLPPLPSPPEQPSTEPPCTEIPIEKSPSPEPLCIEMLESLEPTLLPDSQYLLEVQSTPAPKQTSANPVNLFGCFQQPPCEGNCDQFLPSVEQSSANPVNLFGYLQQPLCEGNCDQEFLPLVEKYKGRFKNNSGMFVLYF